MFGYSFVYSQLIRIVPKFPVYLFLIGRVIHVYQSLLLGINIVGLWQFEVQQRRTIRTYVSDQKMIENRGNSQRKTGTCTREAKIEERGSTDQNKAEPNLGSIYERGGRCM